MLTYYAPSEAGGPLGLGYSLVAGRQPLVLRVPALTGQVQAVLAGGWRFTSAAGSRTASVGVAVVAPTSRACAVEVQPGTVAVGVGLPPAAWRALTACPAQDLVDRACDVAELWGAAAAGELLERLVARSADPGRCALDVLAALGARLGDAGRPADPRLTAVEGWAAEAHRASLDQLCRRLGLCQRQVARLTADVFGFGPKRLQMRYRALRLAARISFADGGRGGALDDLDGYCDQSHLIRSFTAFVGTTPGAYRRDHAAFARAMLIGRWNAGARSPSTLWS